MADEGTREKKSSKKREKEAQEEVSEEEKKVEETKTSSKKKEKEVAEEKSEEEDKKNGSEEAEKKDTKGKSKKNAKEVDQTAESAEESGDQASDDKPEEKTSKGKKSKEEKQSTESKPPRKKDRKEVVEASEESEEPVVEDKSKDKKKKKQDSIDPDQMPDSPRQNPNPEIPPAVGGKLFLKVAEIKVSQKPKDYYSALFFEKEEIWRTKVISKKTTFEEGGRLHALPEENTEKVPIRVVLFEKGLVGSLLDTQKGEVHLDISTLKDGYPYDKWFPLTNKKGQQKGEIHLQVMYIRKDGDSNGEEFNRPLHVLMKKSRLDLFTRMLEDPVANFDQTDDEGRTALLLAIEMNLSHYVDMLLKKGVDPRKQANNKGHTALHFAAQFRARREIVRALLDKKADPMVKDTDGDNTPLHAAAASDHVDALDLMLAVKKVDVNVKNKQGESPICAALRNGGSNAVRLLLRKGADIYLQNDNDLSVWELSQRKEYVNTEPRKVFMEELNVHDAREFPLRTKYPEKKLGTSKRVHQDYAKSTQVSVTVSEKTKAAFMITTLDANLRNSDFPGKTGFVVLKSDQGKHNEASLQLPSAVGIGGAKPLTLELEPGFFYNVIPYSKTKEVDSEYSLVVLTQEGKPSEIKDLVPWKYEEAQENDWTGKNAGGASQYDSFKNNIQYEVTFPKEDNVEFAVFLSQETNDPKSRMIQGGDHKIATYPHNIGFYVMDRTAAKILESTGSWTDRRDVVKFIKMDFSERNHVTIVPCTVKPGEESAYTLKVFCDQAISVKAK